MLGPYEIPRRFTWREAALLAPCVGVMLSAMATESFGAIRALGCGLALIFAAYIILRSFKSFTLDEAGIAIHYPLWSTKTVSWDDVIRVSLVGDETTQGHPFHRRGLKVVFKSGRVFLPTQGLPAEQSLLSFVRASIPQTCEVDHELPAFLERHA